MSAGLAWGIDLGTPADGGLLDTSPDDFEQKVMAGLFGFTEERLAFTLPDTATAAERWAWRKEVREPWKQRLSATVPLALRSHGYEHGGTALVLKHSLTEISLGAQAVDPAALAAPSPGEGAAFGVVLDRIGVRRRPHAEAAPHGASRMRRGSEDPATWAEWSWPDWVPDGIREPAEAFWSEECGRVARPWLRDAAAEGAPSLGMTVTLGDGFGPCPPLVTGRYVHAWNNTGRLVLDGRSFACASLTGAMRTRGRVADRIAAARQEPPR